MQNPVATVSLLILAASIAVDLPASAASTTYDSTGVQYQIVRFEKHSGAAGSASSGATFAAEFPEFVEGALPDALGAINAFVRYYLPVSSGRQPGFTLEEMADRQMNMWRKMRSMHTGPLVGIGETFTVSVLYNQNGLLCLKFYWWSSGGAHPIDHTDYFNFEMVTGRRLQLSELLADNCQRKLDSLGEREFMLERNLSNDMSLEAAGYHFEDGQFALNENFGIDSIGLLFHFNDYEIAAHVFGPQEVRLSFEQLAELIPRGGWLSKVARTHK